MNMDIGALKSYTAKKKDFQCFFKICKNGENCQKMDDKYTLKLCKIQNFKNFKIL